MTEKVRVLHILPNFGPGGAERLVVNLMEAADKERFEVAAVSLYPESGTILEKEIKEKGLKVYFLNKHRGLDLRMIPQLYRLFRSFRPDIVHTHLYVLRYTLFPTILCRIPVRVHTVHTVAHKEVDRIGKIVHWIAFHLGGVVPVSISREVANTVRVVYGQGVYTPVIYNGIPTTHFVSEAGQNNVRLKKDMVLLHVGTFAPQKNHLLLIEAFALAVKEYPMMQLWLVGDGPLRPDIEKLTKEKGLEGKVLFLGLRDDIPKLLSNSDIFLLPSAWEGVPLTVLEAMAAGKPVIATAVGGVPELVKDGETGILVPPGDPQALVQAILPLVKDPMLRERMGKEGQRRAIERFDITQTAREYEELYIGLLKEKSREFGSIAGLPKIGEKPNQGFHHQGLAEITGARGGGGDQMKIAYITAHTPYGKGETFVLEEMLAVLEVGADLLIIPRNPPKEVFHAKAKELLDRTLWLPLLNWQILSCFLLALVTRPQLWRLIWIILSESRNAKIALKNLAILPKATYVANILKREGVEHIHAHWGSTTATMAWAISELTGIPYSVTLHRWDIAENNMLRTKAESAAFLRFISEDGRDEALRLVSAKYQEKFKVIHMGVRIPSRRHDTNRQVARPFTIACPANLVAVKGHRYLIEACRLLVEKGISNLRCLIIGDGPLEAQIRQQITEAGLEKFIKLLGRVPHEVLMGMYERGEIDAVVLPSIITEDGEKEGIPVALTEAMAYGIPVVSTTIGGIPELLDGGAGLLVPPASSETLAEAIMQLINDQKLRETLKNRAIERINQGFNLQTNVQRLLALMGVK